MRPVPDPMILAASDPRYSMSNVPLIAEACRTSDSPAGSAVVPFTAALALFELESRGRNVYGHDQGGALSGYPHQVNLHNYRVFRWLLATQPFLPSIRLASNGVGPAQITYYPYFDQMESLGLQPWSPLHNMIFGLSILRRNFHSRLEATPRLPAPTPHSNRPAPTTTRRARAWAEAATLYNAGNLRSGVNDYGRRFVGSMAVWRGRLAAA